MKRTQTGKGNGARRASAPPKTVRLTGVLWHEGKMIVSKCPELGVASCGESVEEALDNLREAVSLYIANARELGLLKEIPSLTDTERFTTQFEVVLG